MLKQGDRVTVTHPDGHRATGMLFQRDGGALFMQLPGMGSMYFIGGTPPMGWTVEEHEPAPEEGAYVKPGEAFVHYLYADGAWHRIRKGHAEHIAVRPDGRLVRLEAPEVTRTNVLFEIATWLKFHPRGGPILSSNMLAEFLHEKKES